ncbi:MAG: hypothetical protein GY864_12350 [Desulfobacterales bacterium]|nr:hypothetical protein [Desulfobacterales bacterium]
MSKYQKPEKSKKRMAGSGVAGATGGTALLAWAQSLPDTTSIKEELVLAIPTISVCLTAACSFVQKEISERYARYKTNKLVNEGKEIVANAKNDGTFTQKEERGYKKKLEQHSLDRVMKQLDKLSK